MNDYKTESIHQAIAIKKYTEEYQDFVQMLKHKLSDQGSEESLPYQQEDDQVKFLEETAEDIEIIQQNDTAGSD